MRDEPGPVDDHDLVGELCDLRENVAGDENRAAAPGEGAQEVAQPADSFRIEPVRRLVEDEQLRVAEQRAGDAQALAHAERVGLDPAAGGTRQLDLLEHLVDPPLRDPAGRRQHAKVVAAAPRRVVGRRLQNGADDARRVVQLPVGRALDERLARRWMHQAEQDAEGRGLARAVGAEEASDPPRLDREGEVLDRGGRAEPLGQCADLERRRLGHQPARRSTSR